MNRFLFVIFLAMLPAVSMAGKVALVIGNSAYTKRPLENPVNDSRAISAKLRSLGFTVINKENLKIREIGATLREFRSKISPGDEVVFFYAGHGLQVNGVNYLPVTDADIQGEEDVPLNSLSVNAVLNMLEESKAGIKLLFLDACRDNPYARSFRSSTGGDLGKIGLAPSGTLIHYATRPGSVAADGKSGGNGLYTEHLLKWLDVPDSPIEVMHKKVAMGVEQDSSGKQEPWSEGQLKGEFYFSKTNSVAKIQELPQLITAELPSNQANSEIVFWNSVKDTNSIPELQAYLKRYPKGMFIELAASRIERISSTKTSAAPEASIDNEKKPNPNDAGLLIFKSFLDQMMKNK
jgi:hypothetical protein